MNLKMLNNIAKHSRQYRLFCLLTASVCLLASVASALDPGNANVVGGNTSATVTAPQTQTTRVDVHMDKAIINWDTLDTDNGEILQFIKESGQAFAVLNRVENATQATQFKGELQGNQGNIIIVNPHGIVFGPEALIDAAKFTASSLNITDENFMNENYIFTTNLEVNGEIINNGTIIANDQIAILAQKIKNKGTILCKEGTVLMATGQKIVLSTASNNIIVEVEPVTAPNDSELTDMGDIINEGSIETNKGDIILAAGDTFAQALSVEGFGRVKQHGRIKAANHLEMSAAEEVRTYSSSNTEATGPIKINAPAVRIEEDLASGNDMTIKADNSVIVTPENNLTSNGDMNITTDNKAISLMGSAASDGNMNLKAGSYLSVAHDLTSGGNLNISTGTGDTYSTGNMLATNNLDLNTNLILAENWTLDNESGDLVFKGQTLEAKNGTLTATGQIKKLTPGQLFINGGNDGLAIDLQHNDSTAVATQGNLYINGTGDIKIAGDIDATTGSEWGIIDKEYISHFTIAKGGVSIISDQGSIVTGPGDALNVSITGYSDDAVKDWYDNNVRGHNSNGVDLPYKDEHGNTQGKAAIVLKSQEYLILGPDSSLDAQGYYLPAENAQNKSIGYNGVDDRAAIDFLNQDAVIGGFERDKGISSDIAIYAASTTGNVNIQTKDIKAHADFSVVTTLEDETGIYAYPPASDFGPATVVFDAYDTVSFDNPDEFSGYRVEVASRKTGSLSEAIDNATLPFADNPAIMEDILDADYVLRGAGNYPDHPDTRAWVLDNNPSGRPQPPALPHFEQPKIKGCPVELQAAASELDITSEQLQISFGESLALNPDIQPCDAFRQLLEAATVLKDNNHKYFEAMKKVFTEIAPLDEPLTPEMAASIAMASENLNDKPKEYALATQYIDAFAKYVTVLDKKLGSPTGDSVNFVIQKHGSRLIESKNTNMSAYLIVKLEQIGK